MGESSIAPELITPPAAEVKKPTPNPILIFGQGPVIDKVTRTMPIKGYTPLGEEAVNFWGENLAKAASIMYKQNHDQQIIVMGGRTGGENYDSESNLIAKELVKHGVPESAIKNEKLSKETIVNLLGLYRMLRSGEIKGEAFDIMGAPHHVARIKVLMRLFDIPFTNAFSADEVLRWKVRNNNEESGRWDDAKLNAIERRLQMNTDEYYAVKFGEEKKPYRERMLFEDVLIRELLERPESWLGRVAEIDDPIKRRTILEKADRLYSDGKSESMLLKRIWH